MPDFAHHGIDELVVRQEVTYTLPFSDSLIGDSVREAAHSLSLKARSLRGQGGRPAPAMRVLDVDIRYRRLPGRVIQLDAYIQPESLHFWRQEAYARALALLADSAGVCARNGRGVLRGPPAILRLALCVDVPRLKFGTAMAKRLVLPPGVKWAPPTPGQKPNELSFGKFLKTYRKDLDAKRQKKAWVVPVWGTKVRPGDPVTRIEFTWDRRRIIKARHFDLDRLWRDALEAYRLARKPYGETGKRRGSHPTDKLWRDLAKLTFESPWTSPPALPQRRPLGLEREKAFQMGRLFGAASVLIAAYDLNPHDLPAAVAEVVRLGLHQNPGRAYEAMARVDEKRVALGMKPYDEDEPPPAAPPAVPAVCGPGPRFPHPPMPPRALPDGDDT